MPKPFNHTGHKDLWGWLAKNPDKCKCDWPGWDWNGGAYEDPSVAGAECFACVDGCKKCPLIWPENHYGGKTCDSNGGLWAEWNCSSDKYIRALFARLIRDLPVRDGVTCI